MARSSINKGISSEGGLKYIPPQAIDPKHQEFIEKIGNKLKSLRDSNQITTSGLARNAHVSRNGYHLLESNRVYFNILTLLQVLEYYEISPIDFFKEL